MAVEVRLTGIGPLVLVVAACAVGPEAVTAPEGEEAAGETGGRGVRHPELAEIPALQKVSGHLLEARRLAAEGMSLDEIQRAVPTVRFEDGRVVIEVRLDRLDDLILARLLEAGLGVTAVHYRYARIDGSCELDRLDEIAAVSEVATVHPQYGAIIWQPPGPAPGAPSRIEASRRQAGAPDRL